MVYGNYTTLVFDEVHPEETTVAQLKRKIFIKMRIEPRFQKLSTRVPDKEDVEECHNDKLLSDYDITEKTVVFLDNIQDGCAKTNHHHDEEFKT